MMKLMNGMVSERGLSENMSLSQTNKFSTLQSRKELEAAKEALETFNAIDVHEKQTTKKNNRYPKVALNYHLQLDDHMKRKVAQRQQLDVDKRQQLKETSRLKVQQSQKRMTPLGLGVPPS